MRAVIYARISRDEQSKYSISEQIELCQKKMIEEGHEIVDIFVDEGYSSKTMNRPALQAMLSQIKQKKFDIICVWNSDRLTRTVLDGLIMVQKMFRPNGIEFVSYTEDIDTSTPDGMMMFTIRLSMAQRERERIAERVSMGRTARAKKGLRNSSRRPYGYNVNPVDLSLEINEEEARIVRKIFDWYLKGWGRLRIARTLNEMGIPSRDGKKWYETIISGILNNPTYIGAVHYKPKGSPESERIIIYDRHEAIISKEDFETVQRYQERKRDEYMSTSSYDFPFSTIVKCGECGRSYHGKTINYNGKRNPIRLYRCSGKHIAFNACKTSSNISERKLEKLFLEFLEHFDIETATPNKPVDGIDVEKEIKRLQRLLDESAMKRKNYARAMAAGKLDYDTFEELIDEENQKMKQWQAELETLQPVKPAKRTMKDVVNIINNLRINWYMMDYTQRKEAVQKLFEVIAIKKTGKEWSIIGFKLADI
jgi:site-specific DNA recombinase